MEHGIHTLAYGHYSLNKKLCDAGRTATDMNKSIIIAAKIV